MSEPTGTTVDLSDLFGRTLTPEVEAEIQRRIEAAGLRYGGVSETWAVDEGQDHYPEVTPAQMQEARDRLIPPLQSVADHLRLTFSPIAHFGGWTSVECRCGWSFSGEVPPGVAWPRCPNCN